MIHLFVALIFSRGITRKSSSSDSLPFPSSRTQSQRVIQDYDEERHILMLLAIFLATVLVPAFAATVYLILDATWLAASPTR